MSQENAVEGNILEIASRLTKFCCEKFIFGERTVFGRKELFDGEYMEKGQGFYTWPSRKIHRLARDPHPDLEERVSVPDDKVCWTLCAEETFSSYKPEFACESDKNEVLKAVLERRKAAGRQSRFKNAVRKLTSSRISEFNDLAMEVKNSSCGPEDKNRNPCGRCTFDLTLPSLHI